MPRKKVVSDVEPEVETHEMSTEDLLMQQIEMLKAQLLELKGTKAGKVEEPEEEVVEEIKPTKYIRVVSLCPITLYLATMGNGQGKVYKFTKFGEEKRIIYSDLVDVMEHNSTFLEEGYFYILDKEVVRAHGLDDLYATILTKEKMERVIMGEGDAVALFKSANDKQKETITDILIGMIRDNENVDMNMIMQISRLSGVDIIQRAEAAREYSDMEKLKKE